MLKGAIFDVDGTLLDSMSLWAGMGEGYLRSLGYLPKENLTETFKGFSLYQSACYYREHYGVPLSVEEIIAGVNARVEQQYREVVQAKPGLKDFLSRLQEKGLRMCIATATDRYLVEAALERCGLLGFFSEIFTSGEVGVGKSEPLIYRRALEHLGTAKEQTLIFEDALFAGQTAKKDGFLLCGVADRHESQAEALRQLADIYIDSYLDFPKFWKLASAL